MIVESDGKGIIYLYLMIIYYSPSANDVYFCMFLFSSIQPIKPLVTFASGGRESACIFSKLGLS